MAIVDSMENQHVSEYIQHLRRNGFSEINIRDQLLQQGWTQSAIDIAFQTQSLPNTTEYTAQPATAASMTIVAESDKSFVATWLLSFFLGGLGIDRFYLGFIGTGIVKLLTGGGLGVWALIDLIRIGFGLQKDKQGRTLKDYNQSKKIIKVLTLVVVAFGAVSVIGIILLTTLLATPSLKTNANNTKRQNDVAVIDSTVASYKNNHNGALPQSTATGSPPNNLDICGKVCSDGNKVSVNLSYYASIPSVVSFQNYSAGLTVPNAETVYIVDNAACNDSKSSNGSGSSTGIGNRTNGTAAFLYALQSGSGIEQQCKTF